MKKIYLIMTAALAVVSCSKEMGTVENAAPVKGNKCFTAEFVETKVALGDLKEGKRPVTWVAGDSITVFGRSNYSDSTQHYKDCAVARFGTAESGASVTFHGTMEDYEQYAGAYCKGDAPVLFAGANRDLVLTGEVPVDQKYADGSECLYMAEFTAGTNLSFIPVTPVVKFTVKEADANKLAQIKFIGNNNEAKLGGNYNFNFSTMNLAPATGCTNYVSYKPESGKIAAGTYYLPVFTISGTTERTFDKGITFVCITPKGAEIKLEGSDTVTLKRGHITDFGTLNPVIPEEITPYEYPAEPTPCIKEVMGILTGSHTNSKSGAPLVNNINFVTAGIQDGIEFKDSDCSTAGFGIYTPNMGQFVPQGAKSTSASYNHYMLPIGWLSHKADGCILYKIPAKGQDIKGLLEFGCNQSCGTKGMVSGYKFSFSTDNQATWKAPQAIYAMTTTDNPNVDTVTPYNEEKISINDYWRRVILDIPDEDAIKDGGFLYIKVVPITTDNIKDNTTIRINVGAYLKAITPNAELTGSNVILSENFSNCNYGITSMGHLIRYMNASNNVAADSTLLSTAGWSLTNIGQRAGGLFVDGNKKIASITTPALTALGETPTDVILTFRACNYMGADGTIDSDALAVSVAAGPGEVGTLYKPGYSDASWTEMSLAAYQYNVSYVQIKGATSATRITIGTAPDNTGLNRFYLDDIVVTK